MTHSQCEIHESTIMTHSQCEIHEVFDERWGVEWSLIDRWHFGWHKIQDPYCEAVLYVLRLGPFIFHCWRTWQELAR